MIVLTIIILALFVDDEQRGDAIESRLYHPY